MSERDLLGTTDAQVWAREFVRIFTVTREVPLTGFQEDEGRTRFEPVDDAEGLMIGWFANAIETGRTAGEKR